MAAWRVIVQRNGQDRPLFEVGASGELRRGDSRQAAEAFEREMGLIDEERPVTMLAVPRRRARWGSLEPRGTEKASVTCARPW